MIFSSPSPEKLRENKDRIMKHQQKILLEMEIAENARRAEFQHRQQIAEEHRNEIRSNAGFLSDRAVFLQCGHPATIIAGIITFAPDCFCDPGKIVEAPDLTGRIAVCDSCKHKPASIAPSSANLPFFRYRKDQNSDEYFCGCWD